MGSNRFGIDVGSLYRDVETIKGARTRNKMAGMELATAERLEEERPAKELATKNRNIMVADLREKAVGGDKDARDKLMTMDANTKQFIDYIDKADKAKAEIAQKNIDGYGRMLSTVMNASPKDQPKLYQSMLLNLPPEVVENMPEAFDPNQASMTLAKMNLMSDVAEYKVLKHGGESLLTKGGEIVERTDIPVKSSASSGGGDGGLKSGDESLMYRQSAELLGGLFDQAGNITNLDPEVRNKVQGIATEATQIFQQGGVTRTQAVKMAAQKFGVNVQDIPSPDAVDPNDPLGLR